MVGSFELHNECWMIWWRLLGYMVESVRLHG